MSSATVRPDTFGPRQRPFLDALPWVALPAMAVGVGLWAAPYIRFSLPAGEAGAVAVVQRAPSPPDAQAEARARLAAALAHRNAEAGAKERLAAALTPMVNRTPQNSHPAPVPPLPAEAVTTTETPAGADPQAPVETLRAVAGSDAARTDLAGLLDPGFALGAPPARLGEALPLSASLQPTANAQVASLSRPQDDADPDAEDPEAEAPASVVALPPARPSSQLLADLPPLPVPRPFELRSVAPDRGQPAPPAQASVPRRSRVAALPEVQQQSDNRTFFEKIFGARNATPAQGPALAYAAPQDEAIGSRRLVPPSASLPSASVSATSPQTAVYDISARTVTLPSGERLEAHSGLGDNRDDPRSVHVKMKGATPPHVYDLTLRESLFHGVQAIRLNPIGGPEAVHGRVGLLAHTFMLGPNGDSNGCISFRDYNRFLQAYMKGEVRRLVVVARAN